ncbi:MAG: cytochrome d ubiquinol oxidase subunit II [Sporomusaceae bacterium]|nr:cytochrome d ubiquinol oxidase subunit II [Sporomusaceae bacterium]
MELNLVWFVLVAVLFIGLFFLEGFDWGVGMLTPFLGRSDSERRQIINSIGPVWEGNQVWLITAGGATFAAFPHVYATLFSGFYLALFLMLFGLIVRGVAFEFRSKEDSPAWRNAWDWLLAIGSFIPALLWGVAVCNLIAGTPIDAKMQYVGTFFDLLTPYTLVGGIAFLLVFLYHGAAYLYLKVGQELADRARAAALQIGLGTALACLALFGLSFTSTDMFQSTLSLVAFVLAIVAFLASYFFFYSKKGGLAFLFSGLAIAFTTIAYFAGLFPRIMVSSLNPSWSLTITNAAASPMTLTLMTYVALVFVPIILIYQSWVYYRFAKRVDPHDLEY